MSYRRVFKPSLTKRILAWSLILSFGALLVAILVWIARSWRDQPASELWASLGLAGFLLAIVLVGVALLRSYYVLTDDTIEIVRPYGTKIFRVAQLGGFNYLTIVINLVPLLTVRLYGFGLKQVGSIAVNLRDRKILDEWFFARLPVVVHDGSAFSKPRYADDEGKQRDPLLRGS
jgi:hypothetical protein